MLNKQPEIVMMDKKYLVGVASLIKLEEIGVPEPILWELFYNLDNKFKIKRKETYPNTYELEIWSEKEVGNPPDPAKEKFMFMVCVEVDNLNEIPQGFIGKSLPATEYAVFKYVGKPINILKAYIYIFKEWLPKSGYEMPYNYNYAYYRKCDSQYDSNAEIDICLPIKIKEQ